MFDKLENLLKAKTIQTEAEFICMIDEFNQHHCDNYRHQKGRITHMKVPPPDWNYEMIWTLSCKHQKCCFKVKFVKTKFNTFFILGENVLFHSGPLH